MMINMIKKTSGRLTAMLMAACLLAVAVIIPFTPATSTAEAATVNNIILDDSMIDSFTVAVKGADEEGDEYTPCPEEGTCDVSVYDMLRLTIGFHIPAGTLSSSKNTVDAYLELDGDKDNWLHAMAGLYGEQKGNIIINGEEAGTYSVRILNPKKENTNEELETTTAWNNQHTVIGDSYGYRIRIRYIFNQQTVERNQTNAIDNGTLFFNLDSYWLGVDGNQSTVGIGNHTQQFIVKGMHISLNKIAVGEPIFNRETGLIEQRWKVTVINDGSMPIPTGWYLLDTMFTNDAPEEVYSKTGYIPSRGFVCLPSDSSYYCGKTLSGGFLREYSHNEYSSYAFMGVRGLVTSLLSKPDNVYQEPNNILRANSEYWRMAELPIGKTITYSYTSYNTVPSDASHVTNRVLVLPNTKYYPKVVVAYASYIVPDNLEGSPYLSVSKSYGVTTPIDCVEGENGCLTQTNWITKISNTGNAPQYPTWQIVDQLNRTSTSEGRCTTANKISWYRIDDINNMLNSLEEQSIDATLTNIELCGMENHADDGWYSLENSPINIEDAYAQQLVVGVKININSTLNAGDTLTVNYTSTSQGYGWGGSRAYYNVAQACTYLDGNWYCYPYRGVSNTRVIQQVVTECGGGYGKYGTFDTRNGYFLGQPTGRESNPNEIGSCAVLANISATDRGKPITFHTTLEAVEEQSAGTPTGFTIIGSTDVACAPSSSMPACWGITAPTEIGEEVRQTVNNGDTSIAITKISHTEWDITFYTANASQNYYSDIKFWLVFQQKDIPDTAWVTTVAENGRETNSFADITTVRAIVSNGVMDLADKARWGYHYYDNDSTTAYKAKNTHTPYGAAGTKVVYKTAFNPDAAKLNLNNSTVSMIDTVSNLTDKDSVNLETSSIVIKTLNSPADRKTTRYMSNYTGLGNYSGSINPLHYYAHSGDSSKSIIYTSTTISSSAPSSAVTLDPSTYTVHWDNTTHTLTVDGLPDESQLWVEYALIFNSTASSVSPTNTAMLTVDGEPSSLQKATSTNTIPIYKSAAVANISGVFVRKVQEDKPSIVVSGAQYELQKYDGTQYVHDRDFTTTDSTVTLDQLECGTAYRIKETVAPAGYELNSESYDFKLKACENPTGRVPADWSGVDHIVMDMLTVSDRKQPATSTMPMTGAIPWLYLLLGAGVASMIGASLLLWRRQ